MPALPNHGKKLAPQFLITSLYNCSTIAQCRVPKKGLLAFETSQHSAASRVSPQTANQPFLEESCSILRAQDKLLWRTLYLVFNVLDIWNPFDSNFHLEIHFLQLLSPSAVFILEKGWLKWLKSPRGMTVKSHCLFCLRLYWCNNSSGGDCGGSPTNNGVGETEASVGGQEGDLGEGKRAAILASPPRWALQSDDSGLNSGNGIIQYVVR